MRAFTRRFSFLRQLWAALLFMYAGSVSYALKVGDKFSVFSQAVHTTQPVFSQTFGFVKMLDSWGYVYTYLVDPDGVEYHEFSHLPYSGVAGYAYREVTLNKSGTWLFKRGSANTDPFKPDSIDSVVQLQVGMDSIFTPELQAAPIQPTAEITPASQTIVLGHFATFGLFAANSAPTGSTFSGPSESIVDPGATVAVTPNVLGTFSYVYTVPGGVILRWRVSGPYTSLTLQTPAGELLDVTSPPAHRNVYLAGTYVLTASDGKNTETAAVEVELPNAAVSRASLMVEPSQLPRSVSMDNAIVIYGDILVLTATTNGDGVPVYSVISGPGKLSGSSLFVSSVGVIRVKVEYPATDGFTSGSAEADITVNRRPVAFTLNDQDFDFDGTARAARYSVDNPQAILDGMINTAGLTVAPEVNTYTVSVYASGNYSGSASARVRVFPVADLFSATIPPSPQVSDLFAPDTVQWPAAPTLRWATRDASRVRVTADSGELISSDPAQEVQLPRLDVRDAAYSYTVNAESGPAVLSFGQRGGTWARLRGPSLDADVTGQSSWTVSQSGLYTYEFGSNGLSRSVLVNVAIPPAATRSASIAVTPATVSATWADRDTDGPAVLSLGDLPQWKIQTGDDAPSESSGLSWVRSDDNAAGSIAPQEKLLPGTYTMTATFTPPNRNYASAIARATWRLTAPLTVSADNTQISYNGVPLLASRVLRILPGTTATFAAVPLPDYDFGTDWDAGNPQIWSGTSGLISDPGARTLHATVPAGIESLSLTASAYQLGPRVVHFSPVAASYTPMSGPAAGRTYPRTWQNDSGWNAYLGRDGVTFTISGQSRESSIVGFEIEARPPNGEWFTLASGSPADQALNGPRAEVAQTFSARLGNVLPEKPLIPANLKMAGAWELRARVRSSVGTWSGWSPVQTLNVLVPLQTVSLAGRTLPPVQDAAWFTASNSKTYQFQVWVP